MKEILWRLLEKSRMLILRMPVEAWKAAAVRHEAEADRLWKMWSQGRITPGTKNPILREVFRQRMIMNLCYWRLHSWLMVSQKLGSLQKRLNISQTA